MKSKGTIPFLIILIWATAALTQNIDVARMATREVESYVKWFHQNVSDRRTNRALKYVPFVVSHSLDYQVDPLLVSVLISCESSWRMDRPGKIGEIGLMQVVPSNARGFDMATANGQIGAGTRTLRYCFDKCNGDIGKALTKYATGGCYKKYDGLKRRLRLYKEAKERHREQDNWISGNVLFIATLKADRGGLAKRN